MYSIYARLPHMQVAMPLIVYTSQLPCMCTVPQHQNNKCSLCLAVLWLVLREVVEVIWCCNKLFWGWTDFCAEGSSGCTAVPHYWYIWCCCGWIGKNYYIHAINWYLRILLCRYFRLQMKQRSFGRSVPVHLWKIWLMIVCGHWRWL